MEKSPAQQVKILPSLTLMQPSLNQHLSGEAHAKMNIHFKGDLGYIQTGPIETISNQRLEHIVKGDLGAFKLARRFNIN